MMKKLYILIAAVAVALTMGSCGGNVLYDSTDKVDESGWLPTDTVAFSVEVDDTVQLYDFLIEVRNSTTYAYSNLFLFVNTTFPDGSVAYDTLECPLADVAGQWYGKRVGRYVDSRYRLRSGSARFPMTGTYRFAITNGMRDSAIAGIRDVGLRIEYSK